MNPDAVHAHFDRGVLEIRIPKPEQKKPRQVQITLDANPKTIENTDTSDPKVNSDEPVPAPA